MREVALAATRFDSYPIPVAGRVGDDEKARVLGTAIEDLMRRLGGYRESGKGREHMFFAIELDGQLANEHVKELCCVLMKMAPFGGSRRHAFFDDAERCGAMEVPAVAGVLTYGAGPGIVLGIRDADRFHDGSW